MVGNVQFRVNAWLIFGPLEHACILIGRSVVDNHQNESQNHVIKKFSQPEKPKILKIGIFEGILAKYQCFLVHFLVRFGQIFSHGFDFRFGGYRPRCVR